MHNVRPETRRGRSGWTCTRGSERRTCRRCASRAKIAGGTRISSTPDPSGPPHPPHPIHRQPEPPRPAAEPRQTQLRPAVRSTQKPPHRLSPRGLREPVSLHPQSPSGALVQTSLRCGTTMLARFRWERQGKRTSRRRRCLPDRAGTSLTHKV